MDTNDMSKRIKELRQKRDMTLEQVAKVVGVGKSTVRKWETGMIANMKRDKIASLAKALGTTPAYLMGWGEETKNPPNIYDVDGLICFEEIGTICAGYNGSVNETLTGEIVEIPLSMISGGHKEDYFVLRVKGNSMHPRILEGDRILCKRCNSVDSGSFAVVLYDGECATVKKVHYVPGENWLELIPINPEYETKRIQGADLEQCRILGKVVKLIRDL